jgi:hypothetical protein
LSDDWLNMVFTYSSHLTLDATLQPRAGRENPSETRAITGNLPVDMKS